MESSVVRATSIVYCISDLYIDFEEFNQTVSWHSWMSCHGAARLLQRDATRRDAGSGAAARELYAFLC